MADGHQVTSLDNHLTGSAANHAGLLGHSRFCASQGDVCEELHGDYDWIFNLACPASPLHYQSDPIRTTKTSVLGMLNVLGLAKRTGATVLQASTSEIYGDPTLHPQPETYRGNVNPFGPRACYDEGKRCAETLAYDYNRQHGVRVKIARIFNTYGPRMHPDDGRVVSNLIVQALRGEPITLYGDGRQTRAFCFVSDLVDGLIRLMQSSPGFTGPVNLGNPQELSVRDLAARVLWLTNSRSEIVFQSLPQDDPTQRCPDISLARRFLGWQPNVGLDDGLQQTITYFRAALQPVNVAQTLDA